MVFGRGDLFRTCLQQFQVAAGEPAQRPAEHQTRNARLLQVVQVFLDQIRHRDIRDRGKFPGIVDLHFGRDRSSDLARMFPRAQRFRTRPDLRDRIIHQILFHAADVGDRPPFADAADIDAARQQIQHPALEFQIVLVVGVTAPRPVVSDHLRFRIGCMHAAFHRRDHVGNDLFRQHVLARGTLFMPHGIMAVGRIFRHGDAEHAAESFCLAEQLFHGVFQPLQRLRRTRGADRPRMQRRHFEARPLRFFLIEIHRHTARLVQVKIHFDPVFRAGVHDAFQVRQPFFVSGGILFRARDRIQQIQERMHPDAFDAHRRILCQQVFRDRIERFRIAQHIPAARRVGMDVIEIETVGIAHLRPGRKLVGKRKRRFQISHPVGGEILPQTFFQFGSGGLLFRGERGIFQRCAVGFDLADFGPEEIFFLERVGQFFRRPGKQLQDLFIRQQLPVGADQREISVREPFRIDLWIGGQPQVDCRLTDLRFGTAEHFGQPGRRHQFPVPPHRGLPPRRKMRIFHRRFRLALR